MIGQESSYTFHYQRNLQYGENKNGVSLGCIYQNNVGRKYIVLCIGDALKMSFKNVFSASLFQSPSRIGSKRCFFYENMIDTLTSLEYFYKASCIIQKEVQKLVDISKQHIRSLRNATQLDGFSTRCRPPRQLTYVLQCVGSPYGIHGCRQNAGSRQGY